MDSESDKNKPGHKSRQTSTSSKPSQSGKSRRPHPTKSTSRALADILAANPSENRLLSLIASSGEAPANQSDESPLATDRPASQRTLRSALSLNTRLDGTDYVEALKAFARELDARVSADDMLQVSDGTEGISVYVHLPFCPSRCLTCDHQTTVSHDHRQIDRYLDALEREIDLVAERLGSRRRLQQLHLGGGTPNYLTDIQLVRLVDAIDRRFVIDANTETSLEANAHRASFAQLNLLNGLGFRNLNLEIRDLDAGVQRTLGRHQSLAVVGDVVDSAREAGFESVSTDLVYGLPGQSAQSITRTVEQLLSLEPDRVSCYNYSRRPERFQHQRAVDERRLPSLADKISIFNRIVDSFCTGGYDWIGLDCFARPDDRIAKAHQAGTLHRNSIGYTSQPGRNVLGFGSSSVSDLATICVQNHPGIEDWKNSLERGELPVGSGEFLTPSLRARRHALSDLMCNLHLEDGSHLMATEDQAAAELLALRDDGLIAVDGKRTERQRSFRIFRMR